MSPGTRTPRPRFLTNYFSCDNYKCYVLFPLYASRFPVLPRISQSILLQYLPPIIQWHLPDLSLTLPCGSPSLSWHFLITFPIIPRQFSSIPHPTQRYSMTPPRPFPDLTLRLPALSWHFLITFPHHSSSIFLHSSPPLNIIG